jgi:CBS domain-containing protein
VDDGVSTLAVVDDKGKLVGNLSPSDYAAVNFTNIDTLQFPVGRFLSDYKPTSLKPITVPQTTSLYAALEAIVANHVHSLWVVDKEGKPTNSLSLTDIMRTLRDLRMTPNKPVSSRLPGKLTIDMTHVADLPKPANRATFTLSGGDRVVVKSTEETTASVSPSLKFHEIVFQLDRTDENASVQLTFYHNTEEIASRSFPVAWVQSGFGTGSPAAQQIEDVYKLHGGHGVVNLSMKFTA